jgi:hypothetical protein
VFKRVVWAEEPPEFFSLQADVDKGQGLTYSNLMRIDPYYDWTTPDPDEWSEPDEGPDEW